MTNEQIIENAKQELLAQGILKPTGRILIARLEDGSEIQMPEAEEMHTYKAWKSRGYYVRKGEKAITRLSIWKHIPKTETIPLQDGTLKEIDASKVFLQTAFFFSQSERTSSLRRMKIPSPSISIPGYQFRGVSLRGTQSSS